MSSKDKKASKKVTKKKSADKEDTKSAKDLDSPCIFLIKYIFKRPSY